MTMHNDATKTARNTIGSSQQRMEQMVSRYPDVHPAQLAAALFAVAAITKEELLHVLEHGFNFGALEFQRGSVLQNALHKAENAYFCAKEQNAPPSELARLRAIRVAALRAYFGAEQDEPEQAPHVDVEEDTDGYRAGDIGYR